MSVPYLKIIVLAVVLCLGGMTAFGQETLTKPPKPEKKTQQQTQSSSQQSTPSVSQPTQSTQQTTSASRPSNGYINGHEYVDLGLSVKWATCNVGASSPTDYGDYFAWGETRTKSTYTEDNCTTYNKNMGDIAGDSRYDVARANWGGTWRFPTEDEIQELIDKCKGTWTIQGGHYGYKITGPNGNSIFLPAAGCRYGTSLSRDGEFGNYWSSSPPIEGDKRNAYSLDFRSGYFYSGNFYRDWYGRYYGQSVRPVSE